MKCRHLVALLLFLYGLLACKPGRGSSSETDIVFRSGGTELHRVRAEVVRTPEERAKGLMFRRELPEDRAMLFLFPVEEVQNFWMKNTLIPLDMIFVSKERKIVGVVEKAAPLSEVPRGVGKPSYYVIEVAGGVAAKYRLTPGTTVELDPKLPGGR